MKYRKEIDGLRALAVIPVIFFHAGFETFSGGFIGVDIFFVISGYLITTIILSELQQEKFSLINFYERRLRRILPALFLVMLVCIPLAWIFLIPSDMKDFSQSLLSVSLFASNILFWLESGYFETAGEFKPLFHTWSLALEEQYYVLFPLFLMLFWVLGKRFILNILIFIFIASFVLSEWGTYKMPVATFYLLPFRGWELLTGSFLAFYLLKPNQKKFSKTIEDIFGLFGVLLILFAIFNFSENSRFPGFSAIIPIFGTALIILFANHNNMIGKFFGNRILVSIGLISYSTYLWHQPLFAFSRHYGVTSFDKGITLSLAILSLILAYFSWKFVETPFRNKSVISKRVIFIFAFLGTINFSVFGLYVINKNGDLVNLSSEQKTFIEYFRNDLPEWNYSTKEGLFDKYREDCNFYNLDKFRYGSPTTKPVEEISDSCFTKKNNNSKVVFIWGDSHAQQLNYGLSRLLPKNVELLQVASSACYVNLTPSENKDHFCNYSNWFAYEVVKKLIPDTIIIGQNLDHNFDSMEVISLELKKIGVEKIIFTGPTPHWIPSLPVLAARFLPNIPKRTYYGIDKELLELDNKLKFKTQNSVNYQYVSLIDYFCDAQGCLIHFESDIANSITSFDYGHLTAISSYNLAKDLLIPIIID